MPAGILSHALTEAPECHSKRWLRSIGAARLYRFDSIKPRAPPNPYSWEKRTKRHCPLRPGWRSRKIEAELICNASTTSDDTAGMLGSFQSLPEPVSARTGKAARTPPTIVRHMTTCGLFSWLDYETSAATSRSHQRSP